MTSTRQGGDIKATVNLLFEAISKLERKLVFFKDEHLGYITSCPSNLGTAMTGLVKLHLEHLGKHKHKIEEIENKHHV